MRRRKKTEPIQQERAPILERLAALLAKCEVERTYAEYTDKRVRRWRLREHGLHLPAEAKFLPWSHCTISDLEKILAEVRIIQKGPEMTYTTWLRSDDCEDFLRGLEARGRNTVKERRLRQKALRGEDVDPVDGIGEEVPF